MGSQPEGREGCSDEHQHGLGEPRRQVYRSLGMSEDEHAARERRRARFAARGGQYKDMETKKSSSGPLTGQTKTDTEADESGISQQPPAEVATGQKRKHWESLVIGNLGENLSHIERKDREIEQHRFIVQYHEKHSPHQVKHNRRILDRLIHERSEMEDNEENNMPQDQREKKGRIARRLDALRSALDESVCEDERINIRAAIQGYESDKIPYSLDFTLIYGGHIVDTCRTYRDSCENRSERLDKYFAEHGSGWLWHEPPLAGSGTDGLALKGICLDREFFDSYRIGTYKIDLEFTIRQDKVSRGRAKTYRSKERKKKRKMEETGMSCQLETLLDSGATFPIIAESDLALLNVDLTKYPAQGTMRLNVLGGTASLKFYEMYVSVCSDKGTSLVGQGDKAVWPTEPRTLGGFCPVLAQRNSGAHANGVYPFTTRLSGMIPFDACYISSAPSLGRLWLGEDRRDVLGTSRLPAHLRYDTDRTILLSYPEEFEDLRQDTGTPDRVVFVHNFANKPDVMLVDTDVAETPGTSELAIGQYQPPGSRSRIVPKRIIRIEPRNGGVKAVPKENPRPWQRHFTKKETTN